MEVRQLSDEKVLELCTRYGAAALEARRKFLGLLPEVNRRRLWEKRGFGSVFEFAAKLAGVSEEQVRNVLNLDRKFVELPVLREKLVGGEVSLNKLIRIAAVVNRENASFWAERVQSLSQNAVETLVRDVRKADRELRAQPAMQEEFKFVKLPAVVAEELEQLQKMGLEVGELLKEFFNWRKEELVRKEEKIEERMGREIKNRSRNVPVAVKHLVMQKFGNKCAAPGCEKRALQLHHVREYALGGSHSPANLRPLCRGHHELAHVEGRAQVR